MRISEKNGEALWEVYGQRYPLIQLWDLRDHCKLPNRVWDMTLVMGMTSCLPTILGLLNWVPAFTGWGKGRNIISAGWKVSLCDPIRHASSHNGEVFCELLYTFILPYVTSLWCLAHCFGVLPYAYDVVAHTNYSACWDGQIPQMYSCDKKNRFSVLKLNRSNTTNNWQRKHIMGEVNFG